MPRIRTTKVILVLFLLLAGALSTFVLRAQAAALPLTALSDQMSRAKAGELSNHSIILQTPVLIGDTDDSIEVNIPADFNMGAVEVGDIDMVIGATNPPTTTDITLKTAPADATNWGVTVVGQKITFTHPSDAANQDIPKDDYILIRIGTNATTGATGDAQITNHATPNSYLMKIDVKSNTTVDATGQIALRIVGNDQVLVDGIVDPSITFTLSGSASSFGVIPVNTITSATPDITLTVGTNGYNGYTVFVSDKGDTNNPGMYNTQATKLIPSKVWNGTGPEAIAADTEGYGIRAAIAEATSPTIDDEYDSTTPGTVGGLTLAQQRLAYHDGAMTADDKIAVSHDIRIISTTPAGSYFDTVTYVASGRY